MDLRDKPRHTYKELGRLRIDARGSGDIQDSVRQEFLQDVFVSKLADKGGPLARLADELAGQAMLQSKSFTNHHLNSGAGTQLVLAFKKLLATTFSLSSLSPTVELCPDGCCIEHFQNGSQILKDALGCVQEVRSPAGERIYFCYDSSGNLDSFVRESNDGSLKSHGSRDKHGVVVRNCLERVCAVGVSMVVDPCGCLTIHNTGGQFLALDLIHGLHVERRSLDSLDEPCDAVTGVFAHDGFRLATVFQGLDKSCPVGKMERSCRLRFYGRDGSAIEFKGEEELKMVCPMKVWPPGSFFFQSRWRGRYQALTAWESMKTYVDIIL